MINYVNANHGHFVDGHATVLPRASSIYVISDVGLHKYAFGFFDTST